MHELSIVENIIGIAAEAVKTHEGKSVDAIELEIGELAGIDQEALDFAWDAAIRETVLEHAIRKIDRTIGRALCLVCNNKFHIRQYYDPCPNCGSFQKEILEGNELKVKRITLS
jgi:hydrogenase nickel incorporation protein HypA/HybF